MRGSQEKKEQVIRKNEVQAFGLRFKEAFDNANNVAIARQLDTTEGAIRNYVAGRVPDAEKLIEISCRTNCSIHWLITGEGGKFIDLEAKGETAFLGDIIEPFREIIEKAARRDQKDFAAEVRDILEEGLKARGLVTDKVEQPLHYVYVGEIVWVPIVGTVAAGRPREEIPLDRQELVPVAKDWISDRKVEALRVKGNSMIDDGIDDGDLIIITDLGTFVQGMLVIALVDGTDTTVKRVYQRNGRIILKPSNPDLKEVSLEPHRVVLQSRVITIQKKI